MRSTLSASSQQAVRLEADTCSLGMVSVTVMLMTCKVAINSVGVYVSRGDVRPSLVLGWVLVLARLTLTDVQ